MGWWTTSDPDRFTAVAGGYLRSRAAENIMLLSALQAAGPGQRTQGPSRQPGQAAGPGLLLGWWEPPDGGGPRGAFVHDPALPLMITGMVPEMAAALAAALAKMGRQVSGVDAPPDAADAFAAAWSQRAHTAIKAHRSYRVYRLTGVPRGTPPHGTPALPGTGAWPVPEVPSPAGGLRVATAQDKELLASWLAAFATEGAQRPGSPSDMAADLISYGGAVFWEAPREPGRFPYAAHLPAIQPAALVTLSRPAFGTVRIIMAYTLPERRRLGYATALANAVSRALLAGTRPGAAHGTAPAAAPSVPGSTQGLLGGTSGRVTEVVMITDKNTPDRWGSQFGYQLAGERAVLRFGPVTGPMPRTHQAGPMPRLPTGPLPRLPRTRR